MSVPIITLAAYTHDHAIDVVPRSPVAVSTTTKVT